MVVGSDGNKGKKGRRGTKADRGIRHVRHSFLRKRRNKRRNILPDENRDAAARTAREKSPYTAV